MIAITDIWPYPESDRVEDERQERQRERHESGNCEDDCPLCEEELEDLGYSREEEQ